MNIIFLLINIGFNLSYFVCNQASMAVWITILRFMGDLPESMYNQPLHEKKVI